MVEVEWSGEEAQKRAEEAQQNEKEGVEEVRQNAEETTENSLAWATPTPSTDSIPVSATLSTCLPLKTRTTVSQASQEEVAEEDTPQWRTFPSSPQSPPATERA